MKIKSNMQSIISLIAFLIICIIAYIISLIKGENIKEFDRIVVAIAVASYGFSFSSTIRVIQKYFKDLTQLFLMAAKETAAYELDSNKEKNSFEEAYAKLRNKSSKLLSLFNVSCSLLNVISFIMFFSISIFDLLYKKFAILSNFYSLLAFVLLLISILVEEIYSNLFDLKKSKIDKKLKDLKNSK